jgi:LysR family transcriptional activator of dmlA
VAADIDSGRFVSVLAGYAQGADVWAVYPSGLSISARVRVGAEFLEEWFDRAGMSEA